MIPADYQKADDSAYQLRAILRILEDRARGLSESGKDDDHRLPCSDMAMLCEVAGDLCENIHDMMQMLHVAGKVQQ
ncbi:hypothetical protein [Devosia aurantiaca]|uniref:Uncharacterized protein n=1 Tax=Devosia aurantiaca TaxID=2714858 RepID=A0A6M1SP36_9HYPH|nr:hypothetical protein [Devosia aurantiaca]NGP18890.1 hypothetical protein [Devosia aurantiaca]